MTRKINRHSFGWSGVELERKWGSFIALYWSEDPRDEDPWRWPYQLVSILLYFNDESLPLFWSEGVYSWWRSRRFVPLYAGSSHYSFADTYTARSSSRKWGDISCNVNREVEEPLDALLQAILPRGGTVNKIGHDDDNDDTQHRSPSSTTFNQDEAPRWRGQSGLQGGSRKSSRPDEAKKHAATADVRQSSTFRCLLRSNSFSDHR